MANGNILVWVILALAAAYAGRRLWRSWRAASRGGACGCGCDGCGTASPARPVMRQTEPLPRPDNPDGK